MIGSRDTPCRDDGWARRSVVGVRVRKQAGYCPHKGHQWLGAGLFIGCCCRAVPTGFRALNDDGGDTSVARDLRRVGGGDSCPHLNSARLKFVDQFLGRKTKGKAQNIGNGNALGVTISVSGPLPLLFSLVEASAYNRQLPLPLVISGQVQIGLDHAKPLIILRQLIAVCLSTIALHSRRAGLRHEKVEAIKGFRTSLSCPAGDVVKFFVYRFWGFVSRC